MVRNWADRLLADGVDIVLDQYDLKEGHDKHAFMEKMVTDLGVTHVLVVCDRTYAEKADARKAGQPGHIADACTFAGLLEFSENFQRDRA